MAILPTSGADANRTPGLKPGRAFCSLITAHHRIPCSTQSYCVSGTPSV